MKAESRNFLKIFAIAAFSIWGFATALQIPTFDLDESLYLRAALEMINSGNFWNPTWDGVSLHHKPPFFYWIIAVFYKFYSHLFGNIEIANSLAARTPSLLAYITILAVLFKTTPSSATYFLGATFCALTATAAIFDPLQSLFILVGMLALHASLDFEKPQSRNLSSNILIASIAFASATLFKGLNGLILPGGAFAFKLLEQWLLGTRKQKYTDFNRSLKIGAVIFGISGALSVLGFLFLDFKMGRAFTEEFFLVHHLGRGSAAMESHSGSIWYYLLVLILGSGPLVTIALKKADFSVKNSLFVYFCFFTLVFFSFTATKLPHYLWPLWPALALWVSLEKREAHVSTPNILFWNIAALLPWIISILVFMVMIIGFLFPEAWLPYSTDLVRSLFSSFSSNAPLTFKLGLVVLSFGVIASLFSLTKLIRSQKIGFTLALSTSLIFLGSSYLIRDLSRELIHNPQNQVGAFVKKIGQLHSITCLRYSGPHSPSLSLSMGMDITHNRCDLKNSPGNILIAPKWKKDECQNRGFPILFEASYLVVCGLE